MKFDGHKRARLVAGGFMTPKLDTEDTYSSMISLDTIKLPFLAGELQDLKCMTGDISSAYIQAHTTELIYAITGPEFGPNAGQILLVNKALYGLQSSRNEWHAKLADNLY